MDETASSDRKEEALIAESAAEWLAKLKTAGPQGRAAFLAWLKQSPHHVREVLLATTWDTVLAHIDSEHTLDPKALIDRARSNIVPVHAGATVTAKPAGQPTKSRWGNWPWLATSAAALLVLVLALVATNAPDPHQFETAVGEQRSFELGDGSIIHLNTQSLVEVSYSPGARDVYLRAGQAIFKVRHDATRPFRVHVDNSVIQAIGTQFDVHRQFGRTNVAVIEGSVRIISDSPEGLGSAMPAPLPERIRIGAGELVTIIADGQTTPPAPVNVAEVSAWQQRRLIFRKHTLEEIAAEFNRYNRRLQLHIEDADLKSLRFSGVFDADDPESLLKYLALDERFAFDSRDGETVIRARSEHAL